ncbi:MAG: Asp-tRNA(Asn)/Glu-tRNA(Gln) amidotransferase subunit GatB, partial [Gemmatimonadota bacterium]
LVRARGLSVADCPVSPGRLAELLALVHEGTLTRNLARQVFQTMAETGKAAAEVVREQGLRTVGDSGQIDVWVAEVLAAHPDDVARYRGGEEKLLGHFMGLVMKKSKGKADPQAVRDRLRQRLTAE